jgi:hypothetical protein
MSATLSIGPAWLFSLVPVTNSVLLITSSLGRYFGFVAPVDRHH